MGKGFLSTSSIHLGLTTRCNLKCPFCSRTEVKKSKIEHWVCPSSDKNTDLNLKEIGKKAFGIGGDDPPPPPKHILFFLHMGLILFIVMRV